jgi:MFS family permease
MDEKRKSTIWTRDFIGIILINLFVFCGFQMLLPTLPLYVKSLGGADSVIGWVTGLSTISCLLIRPFSGVALDKYGRKAVLLAGLVFIIVVTMGFMFFPIVGIILVVRVLNGLGWGVATTASNTVAADIIPKDRFGEGMGYFSLSSCLSMAIAPAIGLAVMSAFHVTGLTLFSAGTGVAALILSLLIRYRKVEKTDAEKVKPVYYARAAIRPAAIMFFASASYGSIIGFISLYAIESGIDNIGWFFSILAGVMLLSRPVFGRLIDCLGFHAAMYPGIILLIGAMLCLFGASSVPFFVIAALLFGVGYGAVQSCLQTMAVLHAPREQIGAANATFFTGLDAGIGFGSVLAGMVASAWGYSRMYLLFAFLLIVGGILYIFLLGKTEKVPVSDMAQ